jgi:hypothetical protein
MIILEGDLVVAMFAFEGGDHAGDAYPFGFVLVALRFLDLANNTRIH